MAASTCRCTTWAAPSGCVSPGAIDNGQRIVPRNPQPLSEAETGWMKAIYTQSLRDTPMNRLGTPEEIATDLAAGW
jgi:dihydroxycyclohexadiene carboxylate dehydrogenase